MADSCIEGTGWQNADGYHMRWNEGRDEGAHRIAWKDANGPIPERMLVCHKCDNPGCVNPAHLFLGTVGDNNRDCIRKGRGNRRGGERHHFAKMTDEQTVYAMARLLVGESQASVARAFSIHPSVISRLWRGEIKGGLF